MKVKIRDKDLIGKRFKSNSSNWFTVMCSTDKKSNREKLFKVRFDEINNVVYECLVRKEDILKGKPRNPYFPSVYGIGYLGEATVISNKMQYYRWSGMISRCYNEHNEKFSTYGGNGVTVCDRWLSFENYLEDFTKIQGYNSKDIHNLAIDKDTRIKGNKLYSLDTCQFIPISKNSQEMNCRVNQRYFVAVSPEGKEFVSNNQRQFAKDHGLTYKGINAVLTNKQATHRGWKFTYKGE